MSPTRSAWKVASPRKTERERHILIMNKTEKMRGVVALCAVSLANLRELRDALLNERSLLFKALEIKDEDAEKIDDPQLYKIALDLEYNADSLKSSAEDLESVLKDLERLSI